MTARRVLKRTASAALAAAAATALSGCIVVPSNFQSADSRRNANSADVKFLRAGETTLQQVLTTLGEPDGYAQQQTRLYYRSSRDVLTAIGYGDSAPVTQRHSYTVLEFDAQWVLQNISRETDLQYVF